LLNQLDLGLVHAESSRARTARTKRWRSVTAGSTVTRRGIIGRLSQRASGATKSKRAEGANKRFEFTLHNRGFFPSSDAPRQWLVSLKFHRIKFATAFDLICSAVAVSPLRRNCPEREVVRIHFLIAVRSAIHFASFTSARVSKFAMVIGRAAEIKDIQPMGRSLMPEGLLDDLSEAQLRDLFTYLRTSQPMTR
jgi:hypothetical protein